MKNHLKAGRKKKKNYQISILNQAKISLNIKA